MISWVVLAPLAAAGWSVQLLLATRRRVRDGDADAVDVMGDVVVVIAYVGGAIVSMTSPFLAGGMIASTVGIEAWDLFSKRRALRAAPPDASLPAGKNADPPPKDTPLSP